MSNAADGHGDPSYGRTQCRPYSWKRKVIDGHEELHIWCLDRESRSVLVRVRGYRVPCVIELQKSPKDYIKSWAAIQKHVLKELSAKMRNKLQRNNQNGVNVDEKLEGEYREATAFYFSQKRDVLMTTCPSTDHLRALEEASRYGVYIDPTGVGQQRNRRIRIGYNIIEGSNMDTIMKFIVSRGITHTQWIDIPTRRPKVPKAVGPFGASYEKEYVVRPTEVIAAEGDTAKWEVHPKVFMFDFETYSHVYKNLPDKDWITNAITDVSVSVYRDGDRDGAKCGERLREYQFVFGDVGDKMCARDGCRGRRDFNTKGSDAGLFCKRHAAPGMVDVSGRTCEETKCMRKPRFARKGAVRALYCEQHKQKDMEDVTELEEGVEVRRFGSEKALLEAYVAFVVESDPDVFSGYNISGYDWDYLRARMKVLDVEWPLGACRIRDSDVWFNNKIPIKINPKLTRNLLNLEFDGRITLDVFHMAIREYGKLPMQNLDTVSRFILDRGKHDVTAEEMFRAHDRLLDAAERFARITARWRPMTAADAPLFSSHYGAYPEFHPNVSRAVVDAVIAEYEAAKREKERVGYYCDEDTRLCVDISEKTSMISNICELSGIVGVQPGDVYTRGEQLRGLTLIYRQCRSLGIVVDRQILQGLKGAAGGHVGDGVPGYYKNVITLDFKSMYPSIIMGYNICYSTYVREDVDGHLWRDDQCNVIEWSQQSVEETLVPGKNGAKRRKKKKLFHEDGSPVMEHHRYRFVKAEHRKGIIPRIVEMLVSERNRVRAKIKTFDDEKLKQIYNIRQLGLKVAGNSMYGLMGVGEYGKLPFKIGSMCTAAMGRELILECNRIIEEECNGRIVYNDTDSTMFQIKGVTTGADMIEVGTLLEKYISDRFPDPLYFEFEKCGDFLFFTPKKYVYWLVDAFKRLRNGEPNPGYGFLSDLCKPEKALLLRGNVLVRRDNPNVLKNVYMDMLRNILVDLAMVHSERADAERIWQRIASYADELGIDATLKRVPDSPNERPQMLRKSMHRLLDIACTTIVDLVAADIDLSDLVITGGINDNYASDFAKMDVYFERLRDMGKQVSRGDRVAYIVVERPGHDKLGERMYPVDVFCEMYAENPTASPDVFYYINNVLTNPTERLISVGYRQILEADENAFQRKLYTKVHELTYELLQKGKRVFFSREEAEEIVYGPLRDVIDGEGVITDLERAKANIDALLKSETPRIRTQTSEARKELVTGRKVFTPNLTLKPIEKLAKAYKSDTDSNSHKRAGLFKEFLGELCSDAVKKKLYAKLNRTPGDWGISTLSSRSR